MTTEVKAHTAETTLKFDDIVGAKLSAIPEQIRSIVDQMQGEFMRTLYATISEAVEEVGNVVDAKGQHPTEAFLEMLQKIEFGVNRKGAVTRPEMHMHPDTVPKFVKALEDAGPEFEAKTNQLIEEKEAQALAREEERLGRFKKQQDGG